MQCEFTTLAYDELNNRFGEKRDISEEIRQFNLYAFAVITHIGNVSKLFWSPRERVNPRTAARCKQLRDALHVYDGMLIFGRTTRSYLEHYDERLEDWLYKQDRKQLFDIGVEVRSRRVKVNGEWKNELIPQSEDRDYHRYYDPNSHMVYVNQRSFHLQKVTGEIRPLRLRAEKWLMDYSIACENDDMR